MRLLVEGNILRRLRLLSTGAGLCHAHGHFYCGKLIPIYVLCFHDAPSLALGQHGCLPASARSFATWPAALPNSFARVKSLALSVGNPFCWGISTGEKARW